jgi:hypothetical protein
MHVRKLHLHSMLVHAVMAAVPLAAVAFVLESLDITVGGFGPDVWRLLVRAGLVVTLVVALPSTLSGVLERGHMYVTWHRTHQVKLVLSLALVVLVAAEFAALLGSSGAGPWSGAAIVVGNPILAALLSAFGLKMTLGRQSLARTSYRADLFADPPVDVLAINAGAVAEPPDLIDILQEMQP